MLGAAHASLHFGSENYVLPGPPSYDLGVDMDCSEEYKDARMIPSAKTGAIMPSATDDVAPYELLAQS